VAAVGELAAVAGGRIAAAFSNPTCQVDIPNKRTSAQRADHGLAHYKLPSAQLHDDPAIHGGIMLDLGHGRPDYRDEQSQLSK
jgi:hypothetical protein